MNNLRNRPVAAVRFATLWATVLTLLAACGGGGSGVASDPSDPNTISKPPDTTAPVVTITGPTSNATHATETTPLTLSGTASDAVGVTQVGWMNDRGGSGTATGTTSWSASGIALLSGANVLTVTARDAANNTSTDTLTVTISTPQADCSDVSGIEGGGKQRFSGIFSKINTDGSVVVSDVRFAVPNATVYVDGAISSVEDLRVRDVVTVTGTFDSDTRSGCAAAIFADAVVTGSIESVDLSNRTLTVIGHTVRVDVGTVLGDEIRPAQLSSLRSGDRIRVTGLYADGAITATRIDRATNGEGYFVTGVVTDLNAQEKTFRINEIVVQYGGASLVNFRAGEPRDGDTVRLTGTALEAGSSSSAGATVIQPTRMEYIEYGTRLAIFPASTSVESGHSVQFRASSAVTWSMSRSEGGACNPTDCGVIDLTGLYTAPRVDKGTRLLVTATSLADPLDTATASVFVSFLPFALFGPHTIEGEVFAFETGVIRRASVNLWVQQSQQGYSYWWAHGPLRSDDLGLFEAPDLPDSRVSVFAWKDGYVQPCAVTRDVRGDASVRVELMLRSAFDVVTAPRPQLAIEPSVSGVVFETTAAGRRPVAGAVVWLEETMGIIYATTMSDRSGGYFVCNVGSLPTAAWLTVTKDGFENRSVGPVNSLETRVIEIELTRR
jgi:hypothetical protein